MLVIFLLETFIDLYKLNAHRNQN